MICAACRTSDAAFRATVAVLNLILSSELLREKSLVEGNLIGVQRLDGAVRPVVVRYTWYRLAEINPLRAPGGDIGAGHMHVLLHVGVGASASGRHRDRCACLLRSPLRWPGAVHAGHEAS